VSCWSSLAQLKGLSNRRRRSEESCDVLVDVRY